MSASGGTGLHGLLQEATGCAMDTERDWVALAAGSCVDTRPPANHQFHDHGGQKPPFLLGNADITGLNLGNR